MSYNYKIYTLARRQHNLTNTHLYHSGGGASIILVESSNPMHYYFFPFNYFSSLSYKPFSRTDNLLPRDFHWQFKCTTIKICHLSRDPIRMNNPWRNNIDKIQNRHALPIFLDAITKPSTIKIIDDGSQLCHQAILSINITSVVVCLA